MKQEKPLQFNNERTKTDKEPDANESPQKINEAQSSIALKSSEYLNNTPTDTELGQTKKSEAARIQARLIAIKKQILDQDFHPNSDQENSDRNHTLTTSEMEIHKFAELFRKKILAKMEQEKIFIKDKEDIQLLAKTIRNSLQNVNEINLENLIRAIGVDCVLKTPLVAASGGGVTELNDGRKILLYYNVLPWQGKYTLAHELGHLALGHLAAFDGPRTLKQGFKCEWDAERFASSLTKTPRIFAWASWGIDSLMSNIPRLFNRFRKKSEVQKIIKQLGEDNTNKKEIDQILSWF